MTSAKTYELVGMIYSLFGRKVPECNSPIIDAVAMNISDVPDTVAGYIYDRFKLLDTLPQNLTKAILGAWETWLMENPRSVYREVCPVCQGAGGFDCWGLTAAEDEPGGCQARPWHFFAFCPACAKRREGFLYLTPVQWEARGILVMPPDYPGGKLRFETDHGIRDEPEHDAAVKRSLRALKLKMNRRTGYSRDYGAAV